MAETVNVNIANKPFTCARLADAQLPDIAAIYVILCVEQGGSWKVLDVGQSGEVGDRIQNHDRRPCWERNCPGKNIWVCVYPMPSNQYTPDDRRQLERTIRQQYSPPCGSR